MEEKKLVEEVRNNLKVGVPIKKELATEKKVVDIDSIFPNEHNPNVQSDYIYQKMKDTIEKKGLFGSIIVCRHPVEGHYIILDGEHRWKAMKELGHTEIPVEVAVDNLTDNDIKFWTIYFNNTRGKDDVMKRAKLLHDIENGMVPLLPFTEDEMKNEKELVSFDFAQYEKSVEATEKMEFPKIVHFKLSEQEYRIWNECLEIDREKSQKKRTPEAILMIMIDEWLSRRIIR